jgi:hypothetical protein
MKQTLIITLLFFLTSANEFNSDEDCFPDKGIKTAIITGKIKTKKKKIIESRKIEFNKDGQPIVIINNKNQEEENKREYKDGKLHLIITTRKKLPDFYFEEELESLLKKASIVKDTAFILNHYKDGRPSKIKSSDGMIQILEYLGSCEKELITTLNPEGDTIQQNQSKFKDGVLIETTWTLFNPVKSIRTSKYFGYKFDKSGHWIKRNYAHQGKEVITETRKLTYY